MSDIDKVYDLLERFYVEFQENKSEVNQRLDTLEVGQQKLEKRMGKLELTLENDIKLSLQTLHERAEMNTRKLEEHDARLESIENKLDSLTITVKSQDKRLTLVEEKRKQVK